MPEMIEVKTSELSGAALDWAVAKCEGVSYQPVYISCTGNRDGKLDQWFVSNFNPSTKWADGGPLIDKYSVMLTYHNAPDRTPLATTEVMHPAFESGGSSLVAICRTVVASCIGDIVNIPAELVSTLNPRIDPGRR